MIDAQLPPALARWLREAGHAAVHVEELGLRDADDGPAICPAISGCHSSFVMRAS